MAPPLTPRRLPEAFGAEIVDASLHALLTPEGIATWHAALAEHQLVVIRGIPLEPGEQAALASTLGPPLVENPSGRVYQFVSNTHEEGILGDEAFAFHSDHAFMEDPIEVISLYGLEIPPEGSSTRFVNGFAAARALPEALRERVGDLRARHSIDPDGEHADIPIRGPRRGAHLPHAYHPVLWTGARCDGPVLYVNEQQTDLVEGLPDAESVALVEALFAHLYGGAFTYVHGWREDDLVVWDNRALQHARDAIPLGSSRNLRRVAVGGTSVFDHFRDDARYGRFVPD